MDKLLNRFEVGKREIGRLRFCGKQFSLDGKDVLIDVTDNTTKRLTSTSPRVESSRSK